MKYLLVFIFILNIENIYSQTPNSNDGSWSLCWSDEFNATSLNGLKWDNGDWRRNRSCYFLDGHSSTHELAAWRSRSYETINGLSNFYFTNNDAELNSGKMSLIVRKQDYFTNDALNDCDSTTDTLTYHYTAPSMLMSKKVFKYGYFEMKCRLPNLSGCKNNKGVGANFWLHNKSTGKQWVTNPKCSLVWDNENSRSDCYSEIDIFEFNHYERAHNYTNNSHFIECGSSAAKVDQGLSNRDYFSVNFNNNEYHKFAAAWFPDRIEYYIDDVLINQVENHSDLMIPMPIYIDFNVLNFNEFPDANTVFPYNYEIDYVRVYSLNLDCESDANYMSGDISNLHDGKVKKSISIGFTGQSNNLAYIIGNKSVSLRAIEDIIIEDGFYIDDSSELYINNNSCQ